ncbi:MAG: 5'-methylthioadenosine/adenosylhomocysteine nucleosidase [Fibrobacteres bacterium]|nr:5'-methylthioadenosine/adenosylhomocysteine nucleosidase [Fibrobacterota bacterium]
MNDGKKGPIAILGAMDAEIVEFLAHSELLRREEWNGFTFYAIRLEGREAVLAKCGIGKVFAALVSQHLIDAYAPSRMLFTGVAGALNPAYEIGDVVVSRDCMQHDVDGRVLGFARGNLLYTDLKVFAADEAMARLAAGAPAQGHRIHTGRILTGDQFMNRDEINHHRYLMEEMAGDAVEMEGGAMAQVCAVNKVPFLVVRTISDRADGDAVHDFNRFLPVVAHNSFAIVRYVLSRLPA